MKDNKKIVTKDTAQLSLSDVAIINENIASIALSMSRIAEIYKTSFDTSSLLLTKKAKDPNAPKKPNTPYLLFCQEQREQIKSDNPDISPQEVTKELGAAWGHITPNRKEQYAQRYQAEMKKYNTNMEAYRQKLDSANGELVIEPLAEPEVEAEDALDTPEIEEPSDTPESVTKSKDKRKRRETIENSDVTPKSNRSRESLEPESTTKSGKKKKKEKKNHTH
ncbi:Non-histone chromosomal protein 6 [Basidiobolus ranarum]|uniref:Non-histone chromosomal protein 6 n=1 Tax=Basidiobolus ranarum TaxID=34480 RepID=A0ABR2VNU0_9FUNG